jgi:hypothetical protein
VGWESAGGLLWWGTWSGTDGFRKLNIPLDTWGDLLPSLCPRNRHSLFKQHQSSGQKWQAWSLQEEERFVESSLTLPFFFFFKKQHKFSFSQPFPWSGILTSQWSPGWNVFCFLVFFLNKLIFNLIPLVSFLNKAGWLMNLEPYAWIKFQLLFLFSVSLSSSQTL